MFGAHIMLGAPGAPNTFLWAPNIFAWALNIIITFFPCNTHALLIFYYSEIIADEAATEKYAE